MEMTIQYIQLKENSRNFCKIRKNIDQKTIKSYRINMQQYENNYQINSHNWINKVFMGTVKNYAQKRLQDL